MGRRQIKEFRAPEALALIDALESGEESRMPPRAYVLGYLRAYAGVVGLDPDEVVLRFETASEPMIEEAVPDAERKSKKAAVVLVTGVTTKPTRKRWKARLMKMK